MKNLRFEGLYPPEYYLEQNGYDCRIAIRGFFDARDMMGIALFDLSSIDKEDSQDLGSNFAKTVHLQHAIVELNEKIF